MMNSGADREIEVRRWSQWRRTRRVGRTDGRILDGTLRTALAELEQRNTKGGVDSLFSIAIVLCGVWPG